MRRARWRSAVVPYLMGLFTGWFSWGRRPPPARAADGLAASPAAPDSTVIDLRTERAELVIQLDALSTDLESATRSLDETRSELAASDARLRAIAARYESQSRRAGALAEELTMAKAHIVDLDAQLTRLRGAQPD